MPTVDTIPNTPGRAEIVDIYALTLRRLKDVISGEDFTQASRRKASEKIIAIQRHIKSLNKSNSEWCEKYIPEAYKIGMYQDEKLLKRFAGNKYTAKFSQLHEEAAMITAQGALQDFNAVARGLEQTFVGYVSRAQLIGPRRAIAREIAGGIVEGASRETVTNRLLTDLNRRAVHGIITVGRATMSTRAYAEILARTVTRAARTEGTLNRLKEYGVDLVQISNTNAVDFCTIFEDQIFSLSGKSKRYPKLVHRPPYHPNCTHTIAGFVEDYADENEVQAGMSYKSGDNNLSARELAKKYPIKRDDNRVRTKGTQKAA